MTDEDLNTVIKRILDADKREQIHLWDLIFSDRMDQAGMDVVRKRRHELAKSWDLQNFEHQEVVSLIKDREEDFLDEFHKNEAEEHIPEWLMRAEAQDVLVYVIYKELKEEDLI